MQMTMFMRGGFEQKTFSPQRQYTLSPFHFSCRWTGVRVSNANDHISEMLTLNTKSIAHRDSNKVWKPLRLTCNVPFTPPCRWIGVKVNGPSLSHRGRDVHKIPVIPLFPIRLSCCSVQCSGCPPCAFEDGAPLSVGKCMYTNKVGTPLCDNNKGCKMPKPTRVCFVRCSDPAYTVCVAFNLLFVFVFKYCYFVNR